MPCQTSHPIWGQRPFPKSLSQDRKQHAFERSNPLTRLKHLCFHYSCLWAMNGSFCNPVSSLPSLVVQMLLNAHDGEIFVLLVGPGTWAMCEVT